MGKKLLMALAVTMLLAFTAACGSSGEENNSDKEETNKSGEAKQTEKLMIKHKLGKTEIPKSPEKVVVFDYGTLDTLDKLGVEVAGVPKSSLPSYLSKYEDEKYVNVGTLFEPDFEKINEMKPDLIIVSGRSSSAYEDLSEIAPTIYMGVDKTNYMESFKENVKTLGKIFDKKDIAKKELAKIEEAVKKVNDIADSMDKDALVTLVSGGKLSAYGPGSRFGLIHDEFGIAPADKNIETTGHHGQSVSFEYIVEKNPDYLFVIDRGAVVGDEQTAKQVIENELVKTTKAYKKDNIVYLDPGYWYLSSGGLTSVSHMIEEVTKGIQ